MAEVLFYHLSESRLEDALPNLLERTLARGWHGVVQCGTTQKRDSLDQYLWVFRDDSFLAHAIDDGEQLERQPIVLTCEDINPNNSAIRFIVDGAQPPDLSSYERVVFMFDGHDNAQLALARVHWKECKNGGHDVTYWQQSSDKRWEKKA